MAPLQIPESRKLPLSAVGQCGQAHNCLPFHAGPCDRLSGSREGGYVLPQGTICQTGEADVQIDDTLAVQDEERDQVVGEMGHSSLDWFCRIQERVQAKQEECDSRKRAQGRRSRHKDCLS